ncbi:MAG: HAAS signaling domain-containing protein [Planctomycetota bacterium]|jgi:hypothetical protein
MMVTLSESAKKTLNDYLRQARAYLRGSKSVDADEVEQNITEHIENELKSTTEPVSSNELEAVLERLGSPRQWVPEEELSGWRKMIFRLRTGPEDWRLAYLSFGLAVLAALLFIYNKGEMSFILITASFVVSRATLSVTGGNDEFGGQKWLIYPSLVVVCLFVFFWLLVWPIIPLFAIASGHDGAQIDMFPWNTGNETPYWTLAFLFFAGVTFSWWLILALVHKTNPQLFEAVFRPFAKTIRPKILKRFMAIVAGLAAVCILTIILMIKYQGWSDYFIEILGA